MTQTCQGERYPGSRWHEAKDLALDRLAPGRDRAGAGHAVVAGPDREPASKDGLLVRSFARDWAQSNKVSFVRDDGTLDSGALLNLLKRLVTGSCGDSEADAALDTIAIVASIREGDRLMEEGRQTRDPDLMDRAIRLRPKDWMYRVSRGALALEDDDMETWKTQTKAADNIVLRTRVDGLRYSSHLIDELEVVRERMTQAILENDDQCTELLFYLAVHYEGRAKMTGSVDDEMMFHRYLGAMMACGGSGEGR